MYKKITFFLFSFCMVLFAKAQFPYYETFKYDSAPGVVIGGTARLTAAAGIDPNGQGYLRLTDATNTQVGYIYSDKIFSSYYGITASYEFFTYKDQPVNQADGFTFFLFDASINTFRQGAFGGALGYAQRNYNGVLVPGLGKGYIGIGVDEYGNYSTNLEGKSGPVSTLVPSSIAVRGPGDGTDANKDYVYQAGVSCSTAPHTAFSFLGFNKRYPDSSDVHYRRVKFILAPGSSLGAAGYTITVILYKGSGFVNTPVIPDTLINKMDYPYAAPPFLKYGLSGSTGGATDVHEIRSVIIIPTSAAELLPPTLSNDVITTAYDNAANLIDVAANDVCNNRNGSINKTTIDLDPATPGQQTTFTFAGKGTFTLTANGIVSFTPASGFTGYCSINYNVSDNYGLQALTPAKISVTVKAGNPPILTISNPPAVCAGTTVDITSSAWKTQTSPGATYDYFATLGDANASSNNINAKATAIDTSGTYYIRAAANGAYTVQPIVVQIYQKPTIATVGGELIYCTDAGSNNTVTLLGNTPAAGVGKWSLVSGPDNDAQILLPYSPSAVVQNLHVGTYTFRWTISNGPCDSSSAIKKVTFYASATIAVTPASRAICNGVSDTLKGNTPVYGTGAWVQTSGPAVNIDSANHPVAYVKNLAPGSSYTFKYTITNGICRSWTYYTDSSLVNTMSYAGADQNISLNQTYLAGNTPGNGNTGKWSLASAPQGNTIAIADTANPATSVTGFNKFGRYTFRWAISNGSCSSTSLVNVNYAGVLPLSFISFTAIPGAQSNVLHWQVANAGSITHFVIERSTDGVHFTPAGTVALTAGTQQYTYTDADIRSLTATNVYYRIAGIGADYNTAYSAIVSIPVMNITNNKVYAWPNPFSNEVHVLVKANTAGKATLTLYSSHGQLISVTNRQVQQGINQADLKGLAQLANGMYILHVQCNDESYTQRITKE